MRSPACWRLPRTRECNRTSPRLERQPLLRVANGFVRSAFSLNPSTSSAIRKRMARCARSRRMPARTASRSLSARSERTAPTRSAGGRGGRYRRDRRRRCGDDRGVEFLAGARAAAAGDSGRGDSRQHRAVVQMDAARAGRRGSSLYDHDAQRSGGASAPGRLAGDRHHHRTRRQACAVRPLLRSRTPSAGDAGCRQPRRGTRGAVQRAEILGPHGGHASTKAPASRCGVFRSVFFRGSRTSARSTAV